MSNNFEETIITPEDPVTITTSAASAYDDDGATIEKRAGTAYSTITDPTAGDVDINDPSIKFTRIMRIGEYKPLKYTTSAPPLPEGYIADKEKWEELLAESKRVKKVVSGAKLSQEEALIEGRHTKLVEKQRIADLENRKYEEKPVSFWDKVKLQANHIASDLAYCANKLYASAKDEVGKETLEQAYLRFNNLELTQKELDASGALLAGFYCRAVVEMPSGPQNPGKTASGWLLITEKLVIFDGNRVHLPNDQIEGNGRHRFSFQLSKIASFAGFQWKTSTIGTSSGEVPTFIPIQSGAAPSESGDTALDLVDAIHVFDQTGCVHQFWDFKNYFGNGSDILNYLNCAWRDAMLK